MLECEKLYQKKETFTACIMITRTYKYEWMSSDVNHFSHLSRRQLLLYTNIFRYGYQV